MSVQSLFKCKIFPPLPQPANISEMTHKRFLYLRAWARFLLRLLGKNENNLLKEVLFQTFLHISWRQFIFITEMCPRWNVRSVERPRCNRNSADGQLGRALPPASPSHLHPIPSPGSDFTSFDISTARKGGWESEQKAEKPALNYACKASLKTPIPRVVVRKMPDRGDTAHLRGLSVQRNGMVLRARTSCSSYLKHNSHLLTNHRRFRFGETQ